MRTEPTEEQTDFIESEGNGSLLVAPAGCGKTEALAHRIDYLIKRGLLAEHQKVLALSYSNKAKQNLLGRVRGIVGPGWYRYVTVANFHGVAARVIRSHGEVVGLDRDSLFPTRVWREATIRDLGMDFQEVAAFEQALRTAKADDANDDEVLARLEASGHSQAIKFQENLRSENRLDYDDLLRFGLMILRSERVSHLYRCHFAQVFVDEVQDLSLRHLDIAGCIGEDRITYAGDSAQGIYSFAGAEPAAVFDKIHSSELPTYKLSASYRSSPAVLAAVNVLSREVGGHDLTCADQARWGDRGSVLLLKRPDTATEALELLRLVSDLTASGEDSVGLVARRSNRLNAFRELASSEDLSLEDWGEATHAPRVVELLHLKLREALAATEDSLTSLRELCLTALEESDMETRDEVVSACDYLAGIVASGADLEEAVSRLPQPSESGRPVAPGVHLLTGHVGKGQEFDWVIVVGLEDGHVPDFRNVEGEALAEELRVLHVMVSRAREGLVLTSVESTDTRYGPRRATESRWLNLLRPAVTDIL